jgi:hypothetical protein
VKINFSRQIFEKYPNLKFHENPSTGNRVIACGQTDGPTDTDKHDEANIRFRNFANAFKKTFQQSDAFSEVEERQGSKVPSFYVILQRINTSNWIILHVIMLCCHIIDLVFVGISSCSAMINLDVAVSHITPNPSIYSTPSSVFQEAET